MTDFVLVHGGWHGGWWCCSRWQTLLRAEGHRVFAPTLTGLAERRHLIDCVRGPDTHVDDILQLLEFEGLIRYYAGRSFLWRHHYHGSGLFVP